MSFFKELKRRNVFRVVIAYVIVAWLLLQVGDTLAPALRLPEWVNSTLAFFLILGFPLAIFFAWAYELTPEGIKKEKDVDRTQSITHITGRKLDYLIIAVLVVALGYFAFDKFVLQPSRDAELVQATTESVTEQVVTEPEASVDSDNSIAVLPFVNMSDDAGNEYFSDGISEELLNLLAKIPELRVIARTSSFSYKGKDVKVADLARELKVDHVLEGSVRKAGDQVRITAQLIEAESETHLWSETYDRTLDDIFAIQDEIAGAVVDALKLTLLGDAPKAEVVDPEAYALYLQARYMNDQGSTENLEKSIELHQQALAIEPDYALAWRALAAPYIGLANRGSLPRDEGYSLAREVTEQALAIDPYLAVAHGTLGWIAIYYDRDLEAAARHYEYALSLEPANPHVLEGSANLARKLDRLDESIALKEYGVSHDPLSAIGHQNLALNYFYAGRPDEAIASARTALMLAPNKGGAHWIICMSLLLKGENEAALKAIHREPYEHDVLLGLVMVYHAMGQTAESDAALNELIEKYEQEQAYFIASVLAYRGEADRAFAWLDKAAQYNAGGLTSAPYYPLFASIRDDPRWLPFLESIGMSPEQLAAIEFNVTLPE